MPSRTLLLLVVLCVFFTPTVSAGRKSRGVENTALSSNAHHPLGIATALPAAPLGGSTATNGNAVSKPGNSMLHTRLFSKTKADDIKGFTAGRMETGSLFKISALKQNAEHAQLLKERIQRKQSMLKGNLLRSANTRLTRTPEAN